MMELIRGWLLGITGAAILAAMADGLIPEGGIKQVGKLVCGLVLLFAVLCPVASENMTVLSDELAYDRQRLQLQSEKLREEADIQMKQVIEANLAAYSMDKMEERGVPCQVQVICEQTEEGVFLPHSVQIYGVSGQQAQQDTAETLGEALGLERTQFTFQEGGGM